MRMALTYSQEEARHSIAYAQMRIILNRAQSNFIAITDDEFGMPLAVYADTLNGARSENRINTAAIRCFIILWPGAQCRIGA